MWWPCTCICRAGLWETMLNFGPAVHAGFAGLPETANVHVPTAVMVLFPEAVVGIAAGQGFSAAVTLSGRVFTWGRGKYGALGSGRTEDRSMPAAVPGISDAVQVSLG